MPNFNVHWKGCPHRHLPRIRVASISRTSIQSQTVAQVAAEDVVRSPLSTALEQERKKQLFRLRRRRALRSSRGSSAALRARNRVSQRARQHIQVFRWNAGIASTVNSENTGSKPSSTTARAGSRSGNTVTGSTLIDSNDGAVASIIRPLKNNQPENLYSLMHVAEAPVYWSSNKPANPKTSTTSTSRVTQTSRRIGGEYAHVGPLDPVSRRCICRSSQSVGRSRTYDPRIDPNANGKSRRKTKSTPSRNEPSAVSQPLEKKRQSKCWGCPEFWEAVNSMVLQPKEEQAASQSTKSIVESTVADSVSRSPSQKRILKRFTRELELYLQAAKSLPKQSLVASPSSTTVSAHTIQALKPYQAEFQSAGLAITSTEQRRTTGLASDTRKALPLPPIPPKDEMSTPRKSLFGRSNTATITEKNLEKPKKPPSEVFYSDGTDVIAFTPPHEKSDTIDKSHHKRPSSSSDMTVLGFMTPHEKAGAQPRTSPPALKSPPKTPTKKYLPWLRKQESSPEGPSSPTKSIYASSPIEMEQSSPTGHPKIVHRATDLKGQDLRKVDETPTTSDVTGKRRMEVTTQINEVSGRKAETQLQLPEYADVSTQINDTDPGTVLSEAIESANGKNPALDSRVPLISGRSKTFPVRQANLSENCNHLNPQSFGPAPTVSRPSMVTWKGVDDSTPTNPKFPSLSGTLGPWPFATTELGKNRESPPLPDRVPPSPPRCIQCDAQMKYPPDPEPPGEEEFELMPPYVSAPRGGLGHSCTARSSIQCQQCMPSNSPSDPVSPLQSSRTKKQSRRSTKSDIPEHVMNSTSDDKPSPDFEKILDDIAKGYQSLEERFMHCKVAPGPEYAKEQPVADPVKKTPVPRLKLRLVPTSQSSDKTPAPLPPTPIVLDTAFDVASTSTSLESNKISDKDVFRGLHVATAAACDEDIDKWIEEITGCGVRRFLADLSAFEGLGFNSIAAVAKRAAKQRRGELRAWERVREMRLKGAGEDVSYVIVQESDSPYSGADKKLGLVASDQPVMFRTREKKVAKEPSREELIKDMGYKRDYKGQEGSKERAVRMGWRECGTYGGV